MIAEKQTKANIGVGIGLALNVVAVILLRQQDRALFIIGLVTAFLSLVPWIWGCWNYAEGKGQPGAFGFFGLLGLIGLIVLTCRSLSLSKTLRNDSPKCRASFLICGGAILAR